MLAGGRWTESSSHKVLEVRSPIDGSVVAREKAGSAADAQTAVEAAHDARRKIRDVPAIDRIDMPNRARHIVADHSEDFERTLVLEGGKARRFGKRRGQCSASRIKMTMEEARRIFGVYVPGDWSEDTMAKFALVINEPIGVVACVTPFNYPLSSVVAKVVPALVSRNAVVVKPSSDDPLSAILLAKAMEQGSVSINDAPAHGMGYFPFGGIKDSGLGKEGVGYSIDEMTRLKTIQFNLAPGGLGKARDVPKL